VNSQKHQRQDIVEEKAPPITGPRTAAMPYDIPMKPVYMALFSGLATKAMMVYAPVPSPAAPSPAMARPKIRVVEFGATPQIRLPSSKTRTASKNVNFRGKYLYAFPQEDWKPPLTMKKAEPYHDTLSRPLNSSVIFGIAVATMVLQS
jgi:hypothetical protein